MLLKLDSKKNDIFDKKFLKNIEGIEEFIVDIKEVVSLEKIFLLLFPLID